MKLRVVFKNRNAVLGFFDKLGGAKALPILEEAVGKAAIRTQEAMRSHLDAMIYAQPTSPSGYIRTFKLMRSTHAATPSTDHSGDESKAASGDLRATNPSDVAERRGDQIMSEVGSWISYAEHVHEGVNQPSGRPFVAATEQEAEKFLVEEVQNAVIKLSRIR